MLDLNRRRPQRTFHGSIAPDDLARVLIAEFDHGNLTARQVGRGNHRVVQIASRVIPASGGRTAITVHLSKVEDGVLVNIGQQAWMGVIASLGITTLAAIRNPLSLIGRLDDLAEDIASLQLTERIWLTLERTADSLGASYEISERLRRLVCGYCDTANPVGEPHCVACGAPLGHAQPRTCHECGFVVAAGTQICPECNTPLR
ncbi:MAG TPA: zinc ribbon domain-containing protein [Anaerolineae bacterium]|nr:zinc ribbon domain-containing protein [Anaerolineae bacterium]